jgi:hypothetical protein
MRKEVRAAGGIGKRRVTTISIVVLWLLAFTLMPSAGWAVKYDMCETGISVNEVVSLARDHDIPVMRSGIVGIREHFDPKLVDDSFYKSSEVYYRTTIAGQPSTVYLRLTDNPKSLYEIEVRIFNIKNKIEFIQDMIKILQQKYGTYRERMETVSRYYEWKPDADSRIVLKGPGVEVSIVYTDIEMKRALDAQRRQEKQRSIHKDGSEF